MGISYGYLIFYHMWESFGVGRNWLIVSFLLIFYLPIILYRIRKKFHGVFYFVFFADDEIFSIK